MQGVDCGTVTAETCTHVGVFTYFYIKMFTLDGINIHLKRENIFCGVCKMFLSFQKRSNMYEYVVDP
jgi:hypothetical protein